MLNNPAGRAHALLTNFGAQVGGSTEFRHAWASALGIDAADVQDALHEVRALMLSVIDTANELQAPGYGDVPEDTRQLLNISVAPVGLALNSSSDSARPPVVEMKSLGMFAGYLSAVASDGRVPLDEERQGLIEQVQALMEDVMSDAELPHEVRRAVLKRLREILEALQHLEIGGPDAVRLAAEALAASALANHEVVGPRTAGRMMALAEKAYVACKAVGVVAGSLIAITAAGESLGLLPGPEVPQLLPGPPAVEQPADPPEV